MVKVRIGDLFESQAQTLVNTVNTVGVMGKGVALEFKRRFSDMYDDYVRRCQAKEVSLGRPYLYKRVVPPWILNFPTKDHWRSVARLNDIIRGLEHLEKNYQDWGITSMAVPPLGCGHGGLEWRVVGPTLFRYLSRLDVPVELYAPFGTPHEELQPDYLGRGVPEAAPTRIPAALVALVEVLDRIEREPYHWPIGRVTFQKIAYFATYFGIPTGLEYRRGSFGPYTPDLKRLETQLVNNGLTQEQRLGRMLRVRVGPTFKDAKRAYNEDLRKWEAQIDRLADLFLRMSTNEAELAATVHFAYDALAHSLRRIPKESEVLAEVLKWKQRRRPPLREADVARTIRSLNILGWVAMQVSRDLPIPKQAVAGL